MMEVMYCKQLNCAQVDANVFLTFQMNNMENILRNVTPNSLVIIDELCRSTNPSEGAQLAWNLCSHLASIRGIFNDGRYFVNDEQDIGAENSSDQEFNATNDGIASTVEQSSSRKSNWKSTKLNLITAPFIFLTTHFRSLTMLPQFYFNVVK